MNFHISRWSPLRPQFSSSSLRSPTSPQQQQQHHHHDDPTGTLHDTVTSNPNLNHHHNHAAFASPTIEVDGVDTSDDDLKKDHRHITKNNQDDVDTTTDTDGDEESESDISADDVTQDSRDVLVQRLTDLAEKLSDGNVRTSSIEALHKQVDEMERILKHGDTRASRSRSRHSQQFSSSRKSSSLRPGGGAGGARRPKSLQFVSSTTTTAGNGELSPVSGRGRENNALGIMTGGASPVMSPSWFVSQFQRRPSTHSQQEDKDKIREGLTHSSLSPPTSAVAPSFSASSSRLDEKDELASPRISQHQQHRAASSHHHTSSSAPLATTTTPPEVVEVVKEAEKMCAEMATIIESLQSRRQESDHLHKIQIHRIQLSHQRRLHHHQSVAHQQAQTTTCLFTKIKDLEELVAAHEADLLHLKVELRAIEAQALGYIQRQGGDPELEEAIRRWREDWKELKGRFDKKKKKMTTMTGEGGRRIVSLPLPRRGGGGGGHDGEELNASSSAMTSPNSLHSDGR